MSGLAYFFKPKIIATDSASSTTEKRPGRRSKLTKSSEALISPEKSVQPIEKSDPVIGTNVSNEDQVVNSPTPTPTPKIKLKFNLRSQSVQDTSDDRIITNVTYEKADLSADESSDNEMRLKIDDSYEKQDSPLATKEEETSLVMVSPSKKKQQSSRKKVISRLIGTTANTLAIDEPSPVKILPHDSQFSEVKQTKSGRTIKYTPYFKELVQGATISPPLSPIHSTPQPKRPSMHSKKKQTSIKADLEAIKNGGLPKMVNVKRKKSTGSPKTKKQPDSSVKRVGTGRKSKTPKSISTGKRSSSQL